jgi:hypothetical protein
MILYNDALAMPDDITLKEQIMGNGEPPLVDIEEATKNCDVLDLILVQPKTKRQCKTDCSLITSQHEQGVSQLPPCLQVSPLWDNTNHSTSKSSCDFQLKWDKN